MRTLSELRSAHYRSFTKEEWEYLESEGIVNGFGPSSQPVLQWLLARIAPAFRRSSAHYHDWSYFVGGDEARRLECDRGFFLRLCEDSLDVSWYKMPYYLGLSLAYYYAVRIVGSKYFNFKDS